MPYPNNYPYYRRAYTSSSNNNMTRRWRASQRHMLLPLSLFDPSLQAIYASAVQLQTQSSNIVCCNPLTKEAEEVPYPLTVYHHLAVAPRGIAQYLRARRLRWCCWCSLATETPQFASVVLEKLECFVECFECGFFVSLNKVYETATDLVLYPYSDTQSALQPITRLFGNTQGGKQHSVGNRKDKRVTRAPYGLRSHVKYEKELSPDLPTPEELLDEFKAGPSRNTKKKCSSGRRVRPSSSSKKGKKYLPMDIYDESSGFEGDESDQDMVSEEEYAGTIVIDSD